MRCQLFAYVMLTHTKAIDLFTKRSVFLDSTQTNKQTNKQTNNTDDVKGHNTVERRQTLTA